MSASFAFAGIAEKIGKMIPRLASANEPEVISTVSAIRRTLASAGLDLHDLARRVAEPSFDDIITVSKPAPSWCRPQSPAPPQQPTAAPTTLKPKRETSPWPTFSRLRHSQTLAWLDVVEGSGYSMEKSTRADFDALRAKFYQRPHELLTSAEVRLFNRVVRAAWEKGARV